LKNSFQRRIDGFSRINAKYAAIISNHSRHSSPFKIAIFQLHHDKFHQARSSISKCILIFSNRIQIHDAFFDLVVDRVFFVKFRQIFKVVFSVLPKRMSEKANNAVDKAILLALVFDQFDEKPIMLASLKLTIWKMNLNQMLRNRSTSISDRMNVLERP